MKERDTLEPTACKVPSDDESLLFATDNGWVRHCVCRDALVLHFAEHWMALTRTQYRDFHARLIATVRCPNGQRQLNSGGRFAFRSTSHRNESEPAFTLDRTGMDELLWLLDSARYMLEARDAAQRGYQAGATQGVESSPVSESRKSASGEQ